tara:strand:+ start:533 stop:1015 length:483 start_codon:yes stop_codon:yes gene_type:complete
MKKIFFNLIKRIRKSISWFRNHKGSPSQRSLGFGVGIFCGCFPFFGLQTLMGVFLAKILQGNSIFAVLGTWISNPLTYVPLYYFNYRVGSILLDIDRSIDEVTAIATNDMWSQGWYISSRILVGSICVGFVTGIIGGLSLYVLLKKFSRNRFRDFDTLYR